MAIFGPHHQTAKMTCMDRQFKTFEEVESSWTYMDCAGVAVPPTAPTFVPPATNDLRSRLTARWAAPSTPTPIDENGVPTAGPLDLWLREPNIPASPMLEETTEDLAPGQITLPGNPAFHLRVIKADREILRECGWEKLVKTV